MTRPATICDIAPTFSLISIAVLSATLSTYTPCRLTELVKIPDRFLKKLVTVSEHPI